MIVINKTRSDSALIDKKNVKFYPIGVEEIPIDVIKDILKNN